METYLNLNGDECLIIENQDGSIWSGLKSVWEAEQEAAKEQSGTL